MKEEKSIPTADTYGTFEHFKKTIDATTLSSEDKKTALKAFIKGDIEDYKIETQNEYSNKYLILKRKPLIYLL